MTPNGIISIKPQRRAWVEINPEEVEGSDTSLRVQVSPAVLCQWFQVERYAWSTYEIHCPESWAISVCSGGTRIGFEQKEWAKRALCARAKRDRPSEMFPFCLHSPNNYQWIYTYVLTDIRRFTVVWLIIYNARRSSGCSACVFIVRTCQLQYLGDSPDPQIQSVHFLATCVHACCHAC